MSGFSSNTMRFRKNNKKQLRELIFRHARTGKQPHAHVCRLNQSPWDVPVKDPLACYTHPLSPPPPPPPPSDLPPSVFGHDKNLKDGNDSSHDPKGVGLTNKTDLMVTDETKKMEEKNNGEKELRLRNSNSNERNGKQKRDELYPLPDHTKKRLKPPAEKVAPPAWPNRERKASASRANSNEFYYYSGFGPNWGKTRSCRRNGGGGDEAEKNKVVEEQPINVEDYSKKNKLETSASELEKIINIKSDYSDSEEDDDDSYWLTGVAEKKTKTKKPVEQ